MIYGLRALGLEANLGSPEDACDALLLLGAHLMQPGRSLPAHTVIYNLEQLEEWAKRPNARIYLDLLHKYPVWDYSQVNIEYLGASGKTSLAHVPIGYVPELSRVRARSQQDIDVLFYGSRNERRDRILEQLKARGLKVETLVGIYAEQRDQYLSRAKLVLNMHYYDARIFEAPRVSYLLSNRKAVVCEQSVMNQEEERLCSGMAYVSYDNLVDTCVRLASDQDQRNALERRGFDLFSARSQADILAKVLGKSICRPDTGNKIPLALHLGSGKDFREDAFNVDIDSYWQPDALLDFGRPIAFGESLVTERFGEVRLHENQFETLIANDVLEHIPDLVCAMTNALKLLRPGGEFEISVPYDLSLGAWQDPTHVRAFNENSWLYYTDWFWYLGWVDQRFDLVYSNVSLTPLGTEMARQKVDVASIMRTPRAVDSLQVRLRKRYLSASERAEVAQRRARVKKPQAVKVSS